MPEITINSQDYYAEKGERLWDILIKNGIAADHICGGKGTCKKCLALINGETRLACQYVIEDDAEIHLVVRNEKVTEELRINREKALKPKLALDIGTTTIALAFIPEGDSKTARIITKPNPQRVFGADIMSRIEYASKNGVKELQRILTDEINELISTNGQGAYPEMYVSGNTTMLHLFAGVDPSSMGAYPYKPVFTEGKKLSGKELGIQGVDKVILLPSISAFVGADIVSGINAAGIPSKGKYKMLVDLGTNAEIALYSEMDGICTSAAAGPCFEGANISCGMSATDGAIFSFRLNSETKSSEIKTIGYCRPEGICGTGLIDIISELRREEIIDETGYMEQGEYDICFGVSLNQKDIREFQLAKSAIYSGIITLIEIAEISFDDIESLYISGGFSSKININNAVETGLLPRELKGKCIVLNNSSLSGTILYSQEKQLGAFFTEGNMRYVDLSRDEKFSQLFIDNMNF